MVATKKQFAVRNAFTLIEVSVAIVILGMIIAAVFTVINRALETVSDWQTKMVAFEIARDNMEKLLAQKSLSDKLEYGTSETNPDITWETTVESFYEPVSNQMWMRAVCTSEFKDSNGIDQKIELTHWLTSLTKKQIMQIMEQQQREQAYAETVGEDSSQDGENQGNNTDSQNSLGPVPEGYNSWDEVPADQLFKILENSLNTQQ
ncbi:MAG: prepilin-type N-terminal cleavage/methylation domain-containing protein [Planctomycetaceae bacterium]|nr:prepilin-type N-terminal cleavage/methylation domain-containing protein [Planctomycetaceae bacterium]